MLHWYWHNFRFLNSRMRINNLITTCGCIVLVQVWIRNKFCRLQGTYDFTCIGWQRVGRSFHHWSLLLVRVWVTVGVEFTSGTDLLARRIYLDGSVLESRHQSSSRITCATTWRTASATSVNWRIRTRVRSATTSPFGRGGIRPWIWYLEFRLGWFVRCLR